MLVYFPSCNFAKSSPEAAKKLRAYLQKKMPVAGCCRVDKHDYSSDTALYFCQACREVLQSKMATESLWEYLNNDAAFVWPDYSGMKMNLVDCWRDREHPEIHESVRSILRKMKLDYVEAPENRDKSVFCGNLHFEPQKQDNIELMKQYAGKAIYEMPKDAEIALMKEQADKLSCEWTVCYCNRCVLGINTGGGKAVHLLDLAMGNFG